MCQPFFDELRDPNCRFPDSRHPNGVSKELPNLFDFSRHGMCRKYVKLEINQINVSTELSIAPDMNARLVPPHARKSLKSKGIDLDNFAPMSKDEMMARLD